MEYVIPLLSFTSIISPLKIFSFTFLLKKLLNATSNANRVVKAIEYDTGLFCNSWTVIETIVTFNES